MMKKIHIIAVLLAMLMPTMAWASSHSKHYGKMTVAASPSGAGTVYLSTSKSGATSGDATYSWNCNENSGNDSQTRYCYAKANSGYKFTGWSGHATSTTNPYTLTVSASSGSSSSPTTANMTANFTAYYNVSLATPAVSAGFASYAVKEGNTSLSGLSSGGTIEALKGTTYAFTCNLKETRVYEFAGWDVGGSTASTANPYSRTFTSAATIKAIIKEKDHCTVSLVAPAAGFSSYAVTGNSGFTGSGLSNGGSFSAYNDETYTFTCAVSDSSVYELAGWEVDGTVVTTDATLTRTFSPNTTATVKAIINTKEQYRLTLTKPTGVTSYTVTGPSGASGLSNGGTLDFFGTADFTFNCTLDDSYKFLNWSVTDGDGTSAPTTRTLSKKVSSNTTVAAVVAPKETYTLTLEKPEGVTSYTVTATPGGVIGSLSNGGTTTVREQDSYRFECTINDVEYVFVKWLVKGANGSTIAENENRVFTTTFNADVTVSAVLYKKGVYELTFVKPEQVTSFSITGPNGAVDISEDGKASVYEVDEYMITCAFDEDNWEIVNWIVTDSDGESTASTLNNTTFSSDATITVAFNKIEAFIATCLAVPSGCSYKAGSETVTTAEKKVKGEKGQPLTVTLSAATAGSGYVFTGWYIENQDGSKTYISKDSSVTQTFESHVTLGADFVSAASSSKAALVVKASGGYVEYDDLKAALDGLESGDTTTICKSATLADSAGVPQGATMTVSSGVTLTVASGKTLYVDGAVTNNGTISGTVSKCTKLIKQTGDGTDDSGKPKPFNPYGSVKYWKTAITSPSITISGVSASSHTTIINGLGQIFRTTLSSSAKLIKNTIDSSVAVNHIKSIVGESTSVNVVNDTLNSGMVILLGSDCVINGGLSAKAGFRGVVDCAGMTCKTITNQEVTGNNGLCSILNCTSFTASKVVNITHDYYNCDSVTLSSFNAGNTPILKFYDCGTSAKKAKFSVGYFSKGPSDTTKFHFYSGFYDSMTYITCYVIYGGYYKSNPGSEGKYLATGLNLKAKSESVSGTTLYHVYADVPDKVAQIGDSTSSQYATLQEAVNAVANGQTIKLLKNYDVNETVTIASGKSFTLNLDGYSIVGTSGKIINNGTVRIVDHSGGNGGCSYAIDNNGTMDVTYGTYSGVITLNSGMLTTHNGKFTGTIEFGDGVSNPTDVLAIHGGMFKKSVRNLLVGDFCEVTHNGLYYVGEFPYAIKSSASLSGAEKSWSLTALSSADRTIYLKASKARSAFSSDSDWERYAELDSRLTPYRGFTIDCVISFDRAVAKGSVKAYANAKVNVSDTLDRALSANESYRVLSPRVSSAGYYQIDFYRFLVGDDCPTTLSAGIADVNSANVGTVATIELELCHSNRTTHVLDKDYAVATCRYMLDGKKAAIDRGASRVAYNSLTAAVADVRDGETILVGADTSENVTFNNPGTYIINEYGFAFTGSASAKEGYDFAETTGKDANGFVTHTYVVYIGAIDPVDKVNEEAATTEWIAANVNVNEGETVHEALSKPDDNGNAKWENLVLGQNGAEDVAVVAATNGTPTNVTIDVTFTAPENTGYTVKYAFDKVDSTGEVVANGEGAVQEAPAIDLTAVNEEEPSYFKMRAVLKSDDGFVTTNVPVEKTIGVLKVDSAAEYTILAVPWKSLDSGDIKASELVHAASLSNGDTLYAYDGEGNLKSWLVQDGVWTSPTEVENGQVLPKTDPGTFDIARGKGVWLKRKDPSKPIYLVGQPATSDEPATTDLVPAKEDGEASWNLLASPKLESVDITTSGFKNNTGDEIIVPTAGTPKHYTYKNGEWGYPGATTNEVTIGGKVFWKIKTGHKTDDTIVPAGTGFWYLNKQTGEKAIEW